MWHKIVFRSTVALLVVALFTVFPLAILSLMEHRPTELGVNEGQLRPCPDRPNCVCSHALDARHAIAPIEFAGSSHEAWEKLQRVLESRPRTKPITVTGNYLHAEFTSAVFRFADDVEFLLDERNSVIHIRSASRIGQSDMGVNRRRIERLRAIFEAS